MGEGGIPVVCLLVCGCKQGAAGEAHRTRSANQTRAGISQTMMRPTSGVLMSWRDGCDGRGLFALQPALFSALTASGF